MREQLGKPIPSPVVLGQATKEFREAVKASAWRWRKRKLSDSDFGPLVIKVCSYAPWETKLCLNGHEWARRQLDKKGIGYEALDNGFLSCADLKKLQEICDSLGPDDIDR